MKEIFRKIVITIIWAQSRMVLKKYKPKIVAVTGSVGKTSTKDAIYVVLSSSYHVRKSDKSFNSQLGVPLTILGRPNGWNSLFMWSATILHGFKLLLWRCPYPKWLVLEIGVDRPGGLAKLTRWLKPEVAVITRFGEVPAHIEFFASREEVVAEKGNLVTALKNGGTLILNQDDEDAMSMKSLSTERTLTYGMDKLANLWGNNYSVLYDESNGAPFPMGFNFKTDYEGSSLPVSIKGVLGEHHIYPIMAALLVGISQGLPPLSITHVFENHLPPPGRMRLVEGEKHTMIIDDSYNASPVALGEALRALNDLKIKGRKIAVLGDMLEIGRFASEEHKKSGELAAKVADILITVGLRAKYMAEGALNGGMSEKVIYQYEDSREAGKFLESIIKEGDIILVKGSQGVRMERVVEEIMAEPALKKDLLVRQDEEWLKR